MGDEMYPQVFVAAGLANLVGDMVLILQLRMGIGGAAIATTAAQWAGALFFLGYMRRQARCAMPQSGQWTQHDHGHVQKAVLTSAFRHTMGLHCNMVHRKAQ